jgi:hypothetical protein
MLIIKVEKGILNSFFLIIVFVAPYIVYAKTNLNIKTFIDVILFLMYIFVAIFLRKDIFKKKFTVVFLFAAIFVFFAIINQLLNGYFRVYNLVAPLAAYLGFVFVAQKDLNPIPFKLLMIFNYIYFYIIYYSLNPINFLLPETELNVEAFTNTSSNLIPAILIINLYIFDILDTTKFQSSQKRTITLFAIVNVILILLQRSRAGVLVSIIFLLIKLFENYRKAFYLFISLVAYLTFYFWPLLLAYSEAAGSIDTSSYSDDVRKENIDIFFSNMDSVKDMIVGFGRNFEFMTSAVTQNLAITIWNYYTIFPLILVLFLIFLRTITRKYLPLTYYSVFVLYSFFEGFFLSNYWDFIIYVLLFYTIGKSIRFESVKYEA